MPTVMTLLVLAFVIGSILTHMLWGGILMVRTLLKKLKPWVHLIDEEGGPGWHGRAKIKDGHFVLGKEDDVKRYPVRIEARSMTNDGPVYTLGRQTGANARIPRVSAIRKLLDTDPGAQLAFDIVDPGLLGRTYARRMAQETVDSQTDKDDWKKTAILPLAIVIGVMGLGIVIALVTFAAKSGA